MKRHPNRPSEETSLERCLGAEWHQCGPAARIASYPCARRPWRTGRWRWLPGIFTAYIVHTELFYPGNRAWMLVVCLAALVTLFVAYRLIDHLRWGGLVLSAVASLPLAALIWSQVWPMFTAGIDTPGGLLQLGSPLMWVGLLGICAGSRTAFDVSGRKLHCGERLPCWL